MIIILAELNGSNPKVDLGVGNARSEVKQGSGGGRSARNALLVKKKAPSVISEYIQSHADF